MRILLDTSVAVALREGVSPILRRAECISPVALLSIVSVVELDGGVPAAKEGAAARRAILDEMYDTLGVVPFGVAEAAAYRRIIERCGYSRSRIIDRMIAATAIVANAAVATLNPRDFRDIPGLRIEDWSA